MWRHACRPCWGESWCAVLLLGGHLLGNVWQPVLSKTQQTLLPTRTFQDYLRRKMEEQFAAQQAALVARIAELEEKRSDGK